MLRLNLCFTKVILFFFWKCHVSSKRGSEADSGQRQETRNEWAKMKDIAPEAPYKGEPFVTGWKWNWVE